MSRDCCVALPSGAMGLSAVCDCRISWSYSLTILVETGSEMSFSNVNILETYFLKVSLNTFCTYTPNRLIIMKPDEHLHKAWDCGIF